MFIRSYIKERGERAGSSGGAGDPGYGEYGRLLQWAYHGGSCRRDGLDCFIVCPAEIKFVTIS